MSGRVLCLIGGQYGSEGKGVVAHHIANEYGVHVRVGGPNAGHTFRHEGRLWKMRSLPCGWVNPNATLIIGAGAVFEPELLVKEITETGTDPKRVWVDRRAVVVEPSDRSPSYALKESIGATGEGVGPARVRRLLRGQEPMRTAGDIFADRNEWPWRIADTAWLIHRLRNGGENVLLEGTQGARLSLIHGPWPYTTSADTGAAQLLADCGVPPGDGVEVMMVIRTFPIRVGGNSGPLPHETTWEAISERVGRRVEEFTTVTKRLRRVAWFDLEDVKWAISLNNPTSLVLTFVDYLYPGCEGVSRWSHLPVEVRHYVEGLSAKLGTHIQYIGTGGPNFSLVRVP